MRDYERGAKLLVQFTKECYEPRNGTQNIVVNVLSLLYFKLNIITEEVQRKSSSHKDLAERVCPGMALLGEAAHLLLAVQP